MAKRTYDNLKSKVQALVAQGKIPREPTREQRIDIVYGNTKMENSEITMAMVVDAIDRKG